MGLNLGLLQSHQEWKVWVEMVSVWRSGPIKTALNVINFYNISTHDSKNKLTSKASEVSPKILGRVAEHLDSSPGSIINCGKSFI